MRAVICWSGISGYAGACWRALAARKEVDLLVVAFADGGADTAFDPNLVRGVNCRLLDLAERFDYPLIKSTVAAHRPEAVSLPGWFHPPYVPLAFDPDLAQARFIMGMDSPWRGTWTQRLMRWRRRRYLARMDRVVVAGERSFQYARHLGVPEEKILRGVYGHDDQTFRAAQGMRPDPWPRRFLFIGRYVEEKAIDVLLEGYARYRRAVDDPWELTCCGQGPLAEQVKRAEGVTDSGFVQPDDLPELMARHGVFVLPSRFEPFGVVLAEAASAGLPILCSEACGAGVELVRSYYSGMTVPTGHAAAVADAMIWFHRHVDRLAPMGQAAAALAAGFAADRWADRWLEALGGGKS